MPLPRLPVAGQLRHRAQLQQPRNSQDSYGQKVPVWETVATVWVSVEPISGRELTQASQTQADATHRVHLRYYPGLAPRWQLLYRGRTLRALSVRDIEERGIWMELECVEQL